MRKQLVNMSRDIKVNTSTGSSVVHSYVYNLCFSKNFSSLLKKKKNANRKQQQEEDKNVVAVPAPQFHKLLLAPC